jgi:predicted GNAT family acetyltransferase
MSAEWSPSASDCLREAEAFLEADPVRFQLPLHLLLRGVESPELAPGIRCALALGPGGEVAAVGVQTPPWPVQVATAQATAAAALGTLFAAAVEPVSAVMGPEACAHAFAAAFASAAGAESRWEQSLGVFELTTLKPPRPIAGHARPAHAGERALLEQWLRDFHHEATPNDPEPPPSVGARLVTEQRGWLWLAEDGAPRALACTWREAKGVHSVGPVYTPPSARGQGAASAVVAALSAELLAKGRACTLFTDLANPTSNALYARLGYERVGTFARLGLRRS